MLLPSMSPSMGSMGSPSPSRAAVGLGVVFVPGLLLLLQVIGPVVVAGHSTHRTFQQLRNVPRESDAAVSRLSSEGTGGDREDPRLLELLSISDAVTDLFSPENELNNNGNAAGDIDFAFSADGGGSDGRSAAHDGSGSLHNSAKRVFCNGFTGCGGRFREQRREGLPRKVKRVFCNSMGCFNGNRKRTAASLSRKSSSGDDAMAAAAASANLKLWQDALARLSKPKSVGDLRSVQQLPKRLFCNGYGGCHNKGKRREGSNTPDTFSTLPLLSLEGKGDFQKRFFSSGFDNQMDEIIA